MATATLANLATTYGNVLLTGSGTSATTYSLGGSGSSSTVWTTSAATGPYIYNTGTTSPAVTITGDADIKGNLKVKGVDVSCLLEKIQERLCILVPDPERLAKYEALQEAYNHYKTLEALCVEENKPKQAR
jgi:hypothetical protein